MEVTKVTKVKDSFIVDNSNKRIIYYICDPDKNTKCKKTNCKHKGAEFDCEITHDEKCKVEGTTPFYVKVTHTDTVNYERVYLK